MQGKILSKAPCNDDLFEGAAHKRLAKVIADEIQNDSNCTIVGIDGGWGTGKSNLVGMVENILSGATSTNEPGKYYFFTYDAWGHQNDFPRRTILEELTSEITSGDNPILESNEWKDRLDNLLAKKKRTSTKTIPRLNFALIVLALMTALTPVVAAISDTITSTGWRIAFTVSVYAVFIGFVIWKQRRNMCKHGQTINAENFFTELFLLYKDKIKEEEKFETVSEREPSTKQFKEWMFKINKDLSKNEKVLVVVIDNMDRLPKQKVQELWAALHSFFSEEKYSNIRVIVPFDRAHIRNAFQSENIVNQLTEKDIAVYGDDFINKTFYVVYSVPPPILTGWMHYFCDRWKDAFGEDVKVDNGVLQIYDMLTKEHSPRKIIAFINQFVTIRNLCEETIEDKYIALYIFGRKKIVEFPLEEILTPSYLGSLDFLYKEDERMKECISSLYYQLPVENAMDVIFTRKATLELDDAKTELLDKLKNTTKYWEILNHSITSVTNIENVALALNQHFGDEKSLESSHVWEALYRKSKSNVAKDICYHKYHSILMRNISNKEEYYTHLISFYLSNINNGFDLKNYLDGIDSLHEAIGDMKDDYLLTQKEVVNPEIFLQLILERGDAYSKYGLTTNEESFDDYLVRLNSNDLASKCFYGFIKEKYSLPKYKGKIKELFKNNADNLSIERNLLKRVKEIENQSLNISDYINDTQILNFCNSLKIKDEMYPDAIAMLIARYENNNSNLQNYYNNHVKDFDESLSKKVAECILYYINYDVLLLKTKYFSSPEFVAQVAQELTIGSYEIKSINIKNLLLNIETIHKSTGIDPDLLLNKWDQWDFKFVISKKMPLFPLHKSTQRDFNSVPVTVEDFKKMPLFLFEQCTQISNNLTKSCLSLAKEYLALLEQASWSNSLHEEDFNLNLLRIYHPEQLPFFIDAFKESLRNYATGDSSEKTSSETIENIIGILNDQNYDLNVIFREVRDVFINNANINKDKLKYFGKWLFEYGCLQDKQDSLNKILRSEFLDDNDIVNLILQYPKNVIAIVNASKDNSDFVNKLIALQNTKYKNNANFEKLCDAIKPSPEGEK